MSTIDIDTDINSTTQAPKLFDLKMPENYDFSTRKTNWKLYKPYYILRSDAVWEKAKLYSYFYSQFKSHLYFNKGNFHLISDTYFIYNILNDVNKEFDPSEIGESKEHTPVAAPYTQDGELFNWDLKLPKQEVKRTSTFLSDGAKDMTLLCMLKFFKWMSCNDKSEYKIQLVNKNFEPELALKYDCYRELHELHEHCIRYHFKIMFEMYYFKVASDYQHIPSNIANQRIGHYNTNRSSKSRVLYY